MGIRGGLGIGVHLVRLRLERAWRAVRSRWASAAAGAGTAGALGGALGGVILALLPGLGHRGPRRWCSRWSGHRLARWVPRASAQGSRRLRP